MKQAEVHMYDRLAGILEEDDTGFHFYYLPEYLQYENAEPVSLTLPLQAEVFNGEALFPFFDGLIPEGWLLDIVERNWKINPRDRMGLLMSACRDCIGAVSIVPTKKSEI